MSYTTYLNPNLDAYRYQQNATQVYNTELTGSAQTVVNEVQTDTFNSVTTSASEGCTDGKDDGKIGIFSAIGNAIKGVGKTIVNGVKGMFTDSEGNFSLGKTLLSIGTAAACIAFPAVGVAVCAVGGAMGAVQVGKGIYKAATAETDAEAKQAWQEIGGGTFTVASSVLGAKAGLKAVKATSTAGTNGASALSQLDDTATLGQKAAALGKDMVSSTTNRASSIKSGVQQAVTGLKTSYGETAIGKAEAALKAAKASGNADDIAAAEAALKQARSEAAAGLKSGIKDTATQLWKDIKGKVTKENAAQVWDNIKTTVKNTSIKDIGSKLTGTAKSIYTELTSGTSTYAQVVQQYGYENVAQVLQYLGGTLYASETI